MLIHKSVAQSKNNYYADDTHESWRSVFDY